MKRTIEIIFLITFCGLAIASGIYESTFLAVWALAHLIVLFRIADHMPVKKNKAPGISWDEWQKNREGKIMHVSSKPEKEEKLSGDIIFRKKYTDELDEGEDNDTIGIKRTNNWSENQRLYITKKGIEALKSKSCPECGSLKTCDHKTAHAKGVQCGIPAETILNKLKTETVDISKKVKEEMEAAGLPFIDPHYYADLLNLASRAASLWHSPDEEPDLYDKAIQMIFSDHYKIIDKDGEYQGNWISLKIDMVAWAYIDDLLKLAPIPENFTEETFKDHLSCNLCNEPITEDDTDAYKPDGEYWCHAECWEKEIKEGRSK